MSWSWYLYTTRAPPEVFAADRELDAALARYQDDHDDGDDYYAQTGPGGSAPPSAEDVIARYREYRKVAPPDVLARIVHCRATLAFDYVGDESPLQVSILRFCLERLAPCVFDWGGYELELGETVLARLAKRRSRGPLGEASAPDKPKRPVKPRREKPGEVRAIRIVGALEAARADAALAHDLARALSRLSEPARKYVKLLAEDGAMSDAVAAKRLAVDGAALRIVIDEVEDVLDLP